jgi:hypothetical protein
MRREASWTVAVLLLVALGVSGQTPQSLPQPEKIALPAQPPEKIPVPPQPQPKTPLPTQPPTPGEGSKSDETKSTDAPAVSFDEPHPRATCYVCADFMYWWVNHAPAPPLLTTAPNNGFVNGELTGGILGKPGTVILVDGNALGYDPFAAMRIAVGVNVGPDGFWALEAGGFVLPRRSIDLFFAGNANGVPLLTIPFLDAATGQQASLDVSAQDLAFRPFLSGSIAIHSDLGLGGGELNAVAHSIRTEERSFDLIAGMRVLALSENLTINQTVTPAQTGNITLQFPTVGEGAASYYSVVAGTPVRIFDSFTARNQFFGGQLGGRFQWEYGKLTADLTGKIALGITHEQVNINGFSNAALAINPNTGVPTPNLTTPGGVFALISNIGTYHQNPFTVVPEIGFNLSWSLTSWLRLRMGYSALYWSNLARPGAQIDQVLNSKLIPTGALLPTNTVPIGAFITGSEQGRPYFNFHDTAFWAHGVTFGVECRY